MAYDGYFTFDGTEVINLPRTLARSRALGLSFVRSASDNGWLEGLINADHTSPLDAPWYDPDVPESVDFAGLIPLSVAGIEDATREASAFDFVGDGGRVTGLRNARKEVVFSVALVGASECAVEYGFRWLKRVTGRRNCTPTSVKGCTGADLVYMRCEPSAGDAEALMLDGLFSSTTSWEVTLSGSSGDTFDGGRAMLLDPSGLSVDTERRLRDVTTTRGPVLNGKRTLDGCPGAVWQASFTISSEPFEYSAPRPVLMGLGQEPDPYAEGVTGSTGSLTYTAQQCAQPSYSPIYDPECAALVPPLTVPGIGIGCFVEREGVWDRDYAEIPASIIPLWDEVRPIIAVTAGEDDVRDLRVVFYDDVPTTDCDGYVGEFQIQYVPAGATLTIDASRNRVYVVDEFGFARTADSLVLGGDNIPPIYFGLSCGDSYYVTLDHKGAAPDAFLSLGLIGRTA